LNYIHVGTAFNRLGKMAKRRDFLPRHLASCTTMRSHGSCDFTENRKFGGRELANTTHGIAKLHDVGRRRRMGL
jgi:hypothetical protein